MALSAFCEGRDFLPRQRIVPSNYTPRADISGLGFHIADINLEAMVYILHNTKLLY